MPQSAYFSSFGMPFHWGTRELLNVYFTQAGIRKKQEDSHSAVEITINCYVWIFKKKTNNNNQTASKPTTPHFVVSLV